MHPNAASNPGSPSCPCTLLPLRLTNPSRPLPLSTPQGIDLGLRCLAAAGATTVMTLLNSPAGRFTFQGTDAGAGGPAAGAGSAAGGAAQAGERGSGGVSGPAAAVPAGQAAAFEEFLADVARTGPVPLQMPLFSAHQMGTCRLGECGTVHDSRCWLETRAILLGSPGPIVRSSCHATTLLWQRAPSPVLLFAASYTARWMVQHLPSSLSDLPLPMQT